MNLIAASNDALPVALAVMMAVVGLVSMIFWMVVGWRAMKAHEKIADSHEHLGRIANLLGAKYGQPDEMERRARSEAMRGPLPPPRHEGT